MAVRCESALPFCATLSKPGPNKFKTAEGFMTIAHQVRNKEKTDGFSLPRMLSPLLRKAFSLGLSSDKKEVLLDKERQLAILRTMCQRLRDEHIEQADDARACLPRRFLLHQ